MIIQVIDAQFLQGVKVLWKADIRVEEGSIWEDRSNYKKIIYKLIIKGMNIRDLSKVQSLSLHEAIESLHYDYPNLGTPILDMDLCP